MDLVTETLRQLGGIATRADLVRSCSRGDLELALRDGRVRRLGRGRYALPSVEMDVQVAGRVHGVLSHESAALWHGWSLGRLPELPVVTVPRHRKVAASLREYADIRFADLTSDEVGGRVTRPLRTVIDCARSLPFGEGLAVADQALQTRALQLDELVAGAEASPRTGRTRAVRVAASADPRAANAFESLVRAIALDVAGLSVEPQVRVAPGITPDLVDQRLRIAIECDSWTYHAEKSAFRRDLERYNTLALDGWLVLRINLEHATQRPGYVRDLMVRAVARRREEP